MASIDYSRRGRDASDENEVGRGIHSVGIHSTSACSFSQNLLFIIDFHYSSIFYYSFLSKNIIPNTSYNNFLSTCQEIQ